MLSCAQHERPRAIDSVVLDYCTSHHISPALALASCPTGLLLGPTPPGYLGSPAASNKRKSRVTTHCPPLANNKKGWQADGVQQPMHAQQALSADNTTTAQHQLPPTPTPTLTDRTVSAALPATARDSTLMGSTRLLRCSSGVISAAVSRVLAGLARAARRLEPGRGLLG